MPAGEKRFCAICVVERTGQGSCRWQVRQNARIVRYGATGLWHCQELLVLDGFSPLSVGTARNNWQKTPVRHPALALPGLSGGSHSGLALPGIAGVRRVFATEVWHCQGFLAQGVSSPLSSGTARDCWREAPVRPGARRPAPRTPHVAFCELQRRLRQLQREPYCTACTVDP